MRPMSSLIVPHAVVVLIVVSATAVSAGIGQARADDCLAAPKAASPPGQHWYYRIDRATRRHCWYLHAPLRSTHQARGTSVLADAKIERPAPAAPMPFAAAPMPAGAAQMPGAAPMPVAAAPVPAADPPPAAPAPAIDNAPSQPHVTVLAVKTIAVRPPGAAANTQSRHRAVGAAIQQASARAYRAMPVNNSGSTLFFALVFGLGLTVFLTAIVVRRLAPQASWLWPARSEAGMAWQQERRNYSGAGLARRENRIWPAQD